MTGICRGEKLPAESEVKKMALKLRITISVTDPYGKTGTILKGADIRLFLFGNFTLILFRAGTKRMTF